MNKYALTLQELHILESLDALRDSFLVLDNRSNFDDTETLTDISNIQKRIIMRLARRANADLFNNINK